MQTLKYILGGIGIVAIFLSIVFIVIGFKVVGAVLSYFIGGIAILAIIGFIIYFIGKSKGKSQA